MGICVKWIFCLKWISSKKTLKNSLYADFEIFILVLCHFVRTFESSCKVNRCKQNPQTSRTCCTHYFQFLCKALSESSSKLKNILCYSIIGHGTCSMKQVCFFYKNSNYISSFAKLWNVIGTLHTDCIKIRNVNTAKPNWEVVKERESKNIVCFVFLASFWRIMKV